METPTSTICIIPSTLYVFSKQCFISKSRTPLLLQHAQRVNAIVKEVHRKNCIQSGKRSSLMQKALNAAVRCTD